MKLLLVALLFAVLLSACGGGDPEPEDCVYNSSNNSGREGAQWRARCPVKP